MKLLENILGKFRMNRLLNSEQLGKVISGRDNNFNLLRFIAAVLVIWSHSYALLPNGMASDPTSRIFGFGLAGIAVNAFFAISGFLIVRSYLTHSNVLIFLQARAARILPGLVGAVLFCAFIVGPIFSSLDIISYINHPKLWEFTYSNIAIFERTAHLPGVFLDNNSRGVNGSLWTLPYEVSMYIAVAILGVASLLKNKAGIALICFSFVIYYVFTAAHPDLAASWLSEKTPKFQRLSLYFFLGAAFYIFRDKITLNVFYVVGFWLMTLVAFKSPLFNFCFSIALTYSVFWLAFIPKGLLHRFNRFDDYSYGIYIYAFPLQQSIIAIWSEVSEMRLFLLSSVATMICAWISCKLIEKPALHYNRMLIKRYYRRKMEKDFLIVTPPAKENI